MDFESFEAVAEIERKLDRLAEMREDFDKLRALQEQTRAAAIPAEVTQRLAEIDAEFAPLVQAASNAIALAELDVKTAVIDQQVSVKGARLQAVYAKGRESWDTKKLAGLAIAHPELLELRSFGAPSVSIRVVK